MIVVVGHWEDNEANPFSGRLPDVMRWLNQLVAFGVDVLIMVDDTMAKVQVEKLKEMQDSSPDDLARAITIRRADSLEKAIEGALKVNPSLQRVYVERRAMVTDRPVTSLKDFTHPKDAIYVFGGDYEDTMNTLKAIPDRVDGTVISIDYPRVDKVALYAQEALSCVLYDRYAKGG